MKKIISLSALLLGVILFTGCAKAPAVIDDNQPVAVLNQNVNQPAASDWKTYTDAKSGISFAVPTGWVVSTNETGNLYTYRQNPYLTVTFKTFADQESWQKRINEWNDEIEKGNTTTKVSTVGGLSAKLLETGVYGDYYIDNGTKWFEISTADQSSSEIAQIIQSIKF